MSILLLYLRIFTINRTYRWLIYAGMIGNFCLYAPSTFLTYVFCAPKSADDWSLFDSQRCKNTLTWFLAQAVLVVVLDLYILIVPIPMVLRLSLSRRKKIGVVSVFATASM